MHASVFLLTIAFAIGRLAAIEHDLKGFDDTILFGLEWPGDNLPELTEGSDEPPHQEVMRVRTANKEQYECRLPTLTPEESSSSEEYSGPSPLQLLAPLFTQKICSYRLESYWSYELCHGRFLRQYHEEREGKKVKIQEYYLGRWSKEQGTELEDSIVAAKESKGKPNHTKIDGVSLPYLELVMDEGTLCDLSGRPRMSRIHYVCYGHGKHEVYSFKEISTCEYEVVILTPLLCAHPEYKPRETGENVVSCVPVGGSPKKPRSLLAMEAESLKLRHQTVRYAMNENDKAKDVVAVLKVEKIEKDGETHLKFELHPLEDVGGAEEEGGGGREGAGAAGVAGVGAGAGASGRQFQLHKPPDRIADNAPVKAFLNGENCLNGGTGWWKYEFCYGRSVEQYHVDRSGSRTSLLLGRFNEKAHLEWIRQNPHKAPKPRGPHRKSISHFYSGGDICDRTGLPRQTEVKLKCLENSSSPGQVSLYLLEPRTCQYILGVESPLICDVLPLADDNGLVNLAKPYNYARAEVTNEEVTNEGVTNEDEEKDGKEKHSIDDMNFIND